MTLFAPVITLALRSQAGTAPMRHLADTDFLIDPDSIVARSVTAASSVVF